MRISIYMECQILVYSGGCLTSNLFRKVKIKFKVVNGRMLPLTSLEIISNERPLIDCDFNRSMQHLNSGYRDEDVENEANTEDLLLRYTEGIDM